MNILTPKNLKAQSDNFRSLLSNPALAFLEHHYREDSLGGHSRGDSTEDIARAHLRESGIAEVFRLIRWCSDPVNQDTSIEDAALFEVETLEDDADQFLD